MLAYQAHPLNIGCLFYDFSKIASICMQDNLRVNIFYSSKHDKSYERVIHDFNGKIETPCR
jgi:hypothetical protein